MSASSGSSQANVESGRAGEYRVFPREQVYLLLERPAGRPHRGPGFHDSIGTLPPGDRLRACGQQSARGGQSVDGRWDGRHAPGDAGAGRHLSLRRRRPRHRLAHPRSSPDRIRIQGVVEVETSAGPFPPAAATGRVDSVGPAHRTTLRRVRTRVGLLRSPDGPGCRRPGTDPGGRPGDPRDDRVRQPAGRSPGRPAIPSPTPSSRRWPTWCSIGSITRRRCVCRRAPIRSWPR